MTSSQKVTLEIKKDDKIGDADLRAINTIKITKKLKWSRNDHCCHRSELDYSERPLIKDKIVH